MCRNLLGLVTNRWRVLRLPALVSYAPQEQMHTKIQLDHNVLAPFSEYNHRLIFAAGLRARPALTGERDFLRLVML